jgi:2-polyprenyl-3-methyl-5-hydroxy-6-metoxy-1,4-benzoquinol methylase
VRWPFRKSKVSLTADPRRRIRSSFEEASRDEEHFPSTIDPRIYHVQLILRFFGDLAGKRELDAGCGKGRFARVLGERHPSAEIWGLDLAHSMLRYAPPCMHACAGSLTELPFASGTFHAAYATESLEHAVDIERAAAELCRVAARAPARQALPPRVEPLNLLLGRRRSRRFVHRLDHGEADRRNAG